MTARLKGLKGVEPYDIIVLIGSTVLTFIIVFWVMRYGTAQVSDLVLQAPAVMQDSAASYFSSICSYPGNITVVQEIRRPFSMRVIYNNTHVQARPAAEKYYFSDMERGGYLQVGIEPPIAWVNCGKQVVPKAVPFNERVHKEVLFNQTLGDMGVKVR